MTITRGDTIFLSVKYCDKNKVPLIIPQGATIKFTVKNRIDGTKLFQKEITRVDYDEDNEYYKVVIQSSDTAGVQLNGRNKVDYYYDFQLSYMQDDIEVIKTMDKGKFVIKYDITTD